MTGLLGAHLYANYSKDEGGMIKQFKINSKRLPFLKEKGEYPVECSDDVLRGKARELLKTYGYLLEGLVNGTLEPLDEEERQFIEEIRKDKPTTDCAKTWVRLKKGIGEAYFKDHSSTNVGNSHDIRDASAKTRNLIDEDLKERNRKFGSLE